MSYDDCNMGYAKIVQETERAILVDVTDLGDKVWIPKSVIHDNSEVWDEGNPEGDLVVKQWFAEKEGWV